MGQRNKLMTLIAMYLFSTTALADTYNEICQTAHPWENPEFSEVVKIREKKINDFSQNILVVKKADEIMSKLMSAKSPIIFDWLQKRNFKEKSEEQIVLEWRSYYAQMLVLNSYPQKDKKINNLIENLVDSLYGKIMNQSQQARLNNLFSQAKKMALVTIKEMNLPKIQKKEILDRVQKIKLFWPRPFVKANISSALDVVSWSVAYDPIPNRINMGLEALRYPNEQSLFAVFAHEIGHSFDPCRYGAFFTNTNPFMNVIECLRGPKSVGAKLRDDSKLESFLETKKISLGLYQSLKANTNCNKHEYPPIGTQSDQINESFADWFSAEVLAQNLKGLDKQWSKKLAQNMVRSDLCEQKNLVEGTSYPRSQDRLQKIYLAHPLLLSHLISQNGQALKIGLGKEKAFYCELSP